MLQSKRYFKNYNTLTNKKKVLIITYYWPPSGGSGVQRWLKMQKYLSEFGWQPIIYTAENGEMPAIDYSLEKDVHPDTVVIKQPIWEPYTIYKRFTGRKKDDRMGAGFLSENKKSSKMEDLAVWIRGNMFIPDARKYWIKPSKKFLIKYLKENPIDAIISTGPPHSMHLIALGLKKKLNLPWIADFRDPWTKIDFYDKLHLSAWADKKHHQLEREVVQTADITVTVSRSWNDEFHEMEAVRNEVITNGFDPGDVENSTFELSKEFTITHIGSMNKDRNPHTLWKVLSELCEEIDGFKENLRIQFIGKTDYKVFEDIHQLEMDDAVHRVDYMPHEEVIQEMSKSQLLLLAINDTPNVAGVIPGKLFEYMAVKRPILAIGPPEADAGRIIVESKTGEVINFKDHEGLKKTILFYYNSYLNNDLNVSSAESIDKYSRKSLAEKYVQLLNDIA